MARPACGLPRERLGACCSATQACPVTPALFGLPKNDRDRRILLPVMVVDARWEHLDWCRLVEITLPWEAPSAMSCLVPHLCPVVSGYLPARLLMGWARKCCQGGSEIGVAVCDEALQVRPQDQTGHEVAE